VVFYKAGQENLYGFLFWILGFLSHHFIICLICRYG
jgi:hypothetical protein